MIDQQHVQATDTLTIQLTLLQCNKLIKIPPRNLPAKKFCTSDDVADHGSPRTLIT